MIATFFSSRWLCVIAPAFLWLQFSLVPLPTLAQVTTVEFSGTVNPFNAGAFPSGTPGFGSLTFATNVADEDPASSVGTYSGIQLSGFTSIGGDVLEFETTTATARVFNSLLFPFGITQDVVAIEIPINPTTFSDIDVTFVRFFIQDEFSVQPGSTLSSDDLDLNTFQGINGTSAFIVFESTQGESTVLTIDAISINAIPEPATMPFVLIFSACLLRRNRPNISAS